MVNLWLVFLPLLCYSEVYEGDVYRKNAGFWFLGKFAFENDPTDFVGTIEVNLTCNEKDLPELQNLEVLLYDDAPDSWPSVFHKSLTCEAWRQAAINWDDGTQDIDASYKVLWNSTWQHSNTTWWTKPYITQAARPRFWYVVLSSCDSEGSGYVHYRVHFLNIKENSWNIEFGVNEMGLNTLFLVFFIYYTIFLAIHYFGVWIFYSTQKYVHPLIRLFAVVVTVQYLFILFKLTHYVIFSNDGKGIVFLDYVGDIVEVIAKVCFILMIMLLALGWTITSDNLYGKTFVILAVFFLSGIWIAILIWKLAVQDPAEVELPFALRVMQVILLAIWFVFALWFFITSIYNWKKEDNPVKKALFFRLGILYGMWFVALPISVAFSYLQEPWVRDKIVVSVAICFSTVAHTVMAFLLWPSRAEEYFAVEKPNVHSGALQHYEHL